MASSFTQIYFHVVFAVKFRQSLIRPEWEAELFRVMGGSLRKLGHSPIAINGVPDHVHLLWRHNRSKALPETMQKVKGNASHWVNHEILPLETFRFQHGYGAFSVSPDRVPKVEGYIGRQKQHHQSVDLQTEYGELLTASGLIEIKEYQFDLLC
jgi:REP element-mobilizing transposase RayT